ncbi:MAG: hypothetical protein ACRED5_16435 [Propylenella sp.]
MRVFSAVGAASIALLLLSAPAVSQDGSPVREMMAVSGMTEQFVDLGETFAAGIRQSAAQTAMPPEIAEDFAAIAARVVDGKAFLGDLEAGFLDALSPEIAAVTAFYLSPLGQRLKQAEVASSTPEAQLEIEATRSDLRAVLEGDPERLALAKALDEDLLASELSATTAVSIAQAMMVGAAQSAPVRDPNRLAEMERQLAAAHGQIVGEMRELLLASFAWIYRDFTNEDLGVYAEFTRSDAARAVCAVIFEVTNDFMIARSRKVGEEFGALMRQKRT